MPYIGDCMSFCGKDLLRSWTAEDPKAEISCSSWYAACYTVVYSIHSPLLRRLCMHSWCIYAPSPVLESSLCSSMHRCSEGGHKAVCGASIWHMVPDWTARSWASLAPLSHRRLCFAEISEV